MNFISDLIMKFNTQIVGRIAKRDMMVVLDKLKSMSPRDFLGKDSIECLGYNIPSETWNLIPHVKSEGNDYLTDYTQHGLLVQLSKEIITTPVEDALELMIKSIQKQKKEANLKVYEIVDIYIDIKNKELAELVNEECDSIKERLRSNIILTSMLSEHLMAITLAVHQHEYYSYIITLNTQ